MEDNLRIVKEDIKGLQEIHEAFNRSCAIIKTLKEVTDQQRVEISLLRKLLAKVEDLDQYILER